MRKTPILVAICLTAIPLVTWQAYAQSPIPFDIIFQDRRILGAFWDGTPEQTDAAIRKNSGIVVVQNSGIKAFGREPKFSYEWKYEGKKIKINTYFNKINNKFNVLNFFIEDTELCDTFESNLVSKLGDGSPQVSKIKDMRGDIEITLRYWEPGTQPGWKPNSGNDIVRSFSSRKRPGKQTDFCIFSNINLLSLDL